MDKIEQAILRASQAEQLLANPLFDLAFTDTRSAVLEALASLPDVRNEHAQDLHRMIKCLDKVKQVIETHIDTGKIAQKQLERPSTLRRILGT